jgi:hypothetical protein
MKHIQNFFMVAFAYAFALFMLISIIDGWLA